MADSTFFFVRFGRFVFKLFLPCFRKSANTSTYRNLAPMGRLWVKTSAAQAPVRSFVLFAFAVSLWPLPQSGKAQA
jgi:hypothetical protein